MAKAKPLHQYLVVRSSDAKMFQLAATDPDEACKLFAREVEKRDTSGDFDTGDVDVDLYDLTVMKAGTVLALDPLGE